MKLFTKIFIQIFAAFFVLSQVIFVYILYQAEKQSVRNVAAYEATVFFERFNRFGDAMTKSNVKGMELEIQNLAAINAFRNQFGSDGALYLDGEEVYNSSPYEFDMAQILTELEGTIQLGTGSDLLTIKSGGRVFLLYSRELSQSGHYGYRVLYYKEVTDIYERSKMLFLDGLLFTILALTVIGGLLLRGIHRTIRPLVDLKKAAAAVADGAYDIRLPVRSRDEIGELTASFNQMSEKVEEHVEKLSATNEAQRRLLGSLAHELKTPMTAIIGYADTLLTVRLSDRRREQALNYIGDECRRLSRLSVKMMELTGLYETGEKSFEKRKERAAVFLKRLEDLTAYRLAEKHVRLVTVCEPETLNVEMDVDLMTSLLMNLVDNACKASLEGSVILVRGDEKGFVVEDQGKGIPPEEISRVTEAFYMVDKSRSKSAGSVGLGLALCKQIADLHGAELLIESEEGKGTRVSVLWR